MFSIFRALKAGAKKPLVVLTSHNEFPYTQLVTVLGAFEALYVVIIEYVFFFLYSQMFSVKGDIVYMFTSKIMIIEY